MSQKWWKYDIDEPKELHSNEQPNSICRFFFQDAEESDILHFEIEELKQELFYKKNIHRPARRDYAYVSSDYFKTNQHAVTKEDVPVGTLEFVQAFLTENYGILRMNPIEIPKKLRIPVFLMRDYEIVRGTDIPEGQHKFIKNVSRLKQPTFICDTNDPILRSSINPDDLYQVSDVLNILAEYRVLVHRDKIVGIQFYDGDCTIMPTEDEILKIKAMTAAYSCITRPDAYAMDVAVIKTHHNQNCRNIALLEIQPFVSCGTYGCRGAFLPGMYKDGIRWYIEHNQAVEI